MKKFNNPIAPKSNGLRVKTSHIKDWVRDALDLPRDLPITVAELACREEGCPDVETVIGILEPGKPIATLRVHSAMQDVNKEDVAKAAQTAFA